MTSAAESPSSDWQVCAPNVEWLLHAAHVHGSFEDPDHEVGDLQDMLREAFDLLTEEQRVSFFKGDEVLAVERTAGDDVTCTRVDQLIDLATQHAADACEPDHEAGDLQDLLRAAWQLMDWRQQRDLLCGPSACQVAESAFGEPLLNSESTAFEDELNAALEYFGLDPSFCYREGQQLEIMNCYLLHREFPTDAAQQSYQRHRGQLPAPRA